MATADQPVVNDVDALRERVEATSPLMDVIANTVRLETDLVVD